MNEYYRYEQRKYGSGGREPITYAVQVLILINVAAFALQLLLDILPHPVAVSPWGMGTPGLPPGGSVTQALAYRSDSFLSGAIWRPLTSMFLHGDLLHLFMNMLWLYFFGPEIERTLGTRQFVRFFLLCGFIGVLADLPFYLALSDEESFRVANIVGASGAIMGLLIAYAMLNPEKEFFLFPLPFPINARALVLIVVCINLVQALDARSNVSWTTHFGGMIVGGLYMKLIPKWRKWANERRYQKASDKPADKVGDAVDKIFKFEDEKKKRR